MDSRPSRHRCWRRPAVCLQAFCSIRRHFLFLQPRSYRPSIFTSEPVIFQHCPDWECAGGSVPARYGPSNPSSCCPEETTHTSASASSPSTTRQTRSNFNARTISSLHFSFDRTIVYLYSASVAAQPVRFPWERPWRFLCWASSKRLHQLSLQSQYCYESEVFVGQDRGISLSGRFSSLQIYHGRHRYRQTCGTSTT